MQLWRRTRCSFFCHMHASQNCTQSGANRFRLQISKQKDPSYSLDVITRYSIRKKKILNLKSRSRIVVSECGRFSSMIIQKTSRSHIFEDQHMVSQVLTKGLILFNLSHPAHNICREMFVDILACFKCYQREDHQTSSCPQSKENKICSLCAS